MKLSDLVAELQELLHSQGDIDVVVTSAEFSFEPVSCTEFVFHDGNTCLLID
ncbi:MULTISPECIES: hypothetical protein [Pseudomonas]|jgi:hypothetical protein|uniref:hypothetical protein n=1 Tax=Pseudomonas TaxID=286 RepID=UPI003FD2652B